MGEGFVERVEGETGKVVELSWMRSPMICEGERDTINQIQRMK